MIFLFKAAKNLVSEHYEIDSFRRLKFDCRVYYERDFDMIFHFMAAKNFVAEYYEIDF